MIYAVDKYMDSIKVKTERETIPAFGGTREDKYHYFDIENDARAFIRKRSLDAYYAVEAAVDKARNRHNRNCKKFPPITPQSDKR